MRFHGVIGLFLVYSRKAELLSLHWKYVVNLQIMSVPWYNQKLSSLRKCASSTTTHKQKYSQQKENRDMLHCTEDSRFTVVLLLRYSMWGPLPLSIMHLQQNRSRIQWWCARSAGCEITVSECITAGVWRSGRIGAGRPIASGASVLVKMCSLVTERREQKEIQPNDFY